MQPYRVIETTTRDYVIMSVAFFVIFVGGFGLYDTFAFPVPPPAKGASVVEANPQDESIFGLEARPGQEQVNIILLGCDERKVPKSTAIEGRADTIMVVMVNKRTKRAAVISVPRDLEVDIPPPHAGRTKINAAYAYYMREGKGEDVTRKIVEKLLGLRIDYFVKTNIDAFPRMIDILGGVDIDVDKDMNYDDNWGHLHVHLRKGFYHLNGEQAAGFVRHRHDNDNRNMSSDYERSRRQQYLIREVLKQKASPASILKLPALAREVRSCINTDMSFGELVSLGMLARKINTDKVKSGQLPVTDGLINGVWLSQPKMDSLATVMRGLQQSLLGGTGPATPVNVLNGSGERGLGQTIATQLRSAGFMVGRVGNSSKPSIGETVISAPQGLEDEATSVQQALKAGKVVTAISDQATGPDSSVTVILGRDLATSPGAPTAVAPIAPPANPPLSAGARAKGATKGAPKAATNAATKAHQPRRPTPKAEDDQ